MLHLKYIAPFLMFASSMGLGGVEANSGSRDGNPAITHTYLKANSGERDRLAAFIEANWFAMDAIAVKKGLFQSYRLFENVKADGDWDLIVEVVYNDACGYSCVAPAFEAIRKEHVTVKIDGRNLPDLGKITRSETLRVR